MRLDVLVDGDAGGIALADEAAQAAYAVLHFVASLFSERGSTTDCGHRDGDSMMNASDS
ncbi:MAG: hypothetical protein M3306_10200 [Actinomycetota bacterium]|nr:hypothetical protein [Actinomycetota bacterium]